MSSINSIGNLQSFHHILYVQPIMNQFRRLDNTVATYMKSIFLLQINYIDFFSKKNIIDPPDMPSLSDESQNIGQHLNKTCTLFY